MEKSVRRKFTCRHCGKFVYVDGFSHVHEGERLNISVFSQGAEIESYVCNECGKVSIFLGSKHYGSDGKETIAVKNRIIDKYIYPLTEAAKQIKYVPAKYMREYNEAAWVKEISPKSCALVCRRILEMILENECGCNQFNLSKKVEGYINSNSVPNLTEQAMRYIVGAGNAVAHDKKDQNDDLIRIKRKDCDKLLDALEEVFEHIFIQPKKVEQMQKNVQSVTPKK
ncbi:DUF4145 domain-containing protein [Paenibacillus chitinolyticus]|uniref:DUF4145 domain-containing protein n=1 Tax=Paenibacillus chitinolyticus TaxID=79263 RepID=UPI0035E1F67D